MRFFILVLTSLLPFSSTIADSDIQQGRYEVNVLEMLNVHVHSCRNITLEFAEENPAVAEQYDAFCQTLILAYVSGQGLIHKDVVRILEAVSFAAEKHQFQKRKNEDATPYIIHPIGVAHLLMTIGNVRDPDIIIGALLHDSVEDTQTTFEEIGTKFGRRIEGFVRELTDDKSLSKGERKRLQIEHATGKSAGAAQIKLADKLYNLTDLKNSPPKGWDKDRINAYFRWAKDVVDRLPWVNKPLKDAVDKKLQESN